MDHPTPGRVAGNSDGVQETIHVFGVTGGYLKMLTIKVLKAIAGGHDPAGVAARPEPCRYLGGDAAMIRKDQPATRRSLRLWQRYY